MKIGVCGTGRMGSAIAQRLMSLGHEVVVWNRSSTKTQPLTDAGAKLVASPAELVEHCEVVIVMLLNDNATEAVYRGVPLVGMAREQVRRAMEAWFSGPPRINETTTARGTTEQWI